MVNESIFYKILQSREDRALFQEKLIHLYNLPIISFTLNIPGSKKDSLEFRQIHDAGMEAISDRLKEENCKIDYKESIEKLTGPEGYFSVHIDPFELKKITIDIENYHSLGRLFDIDVFDSNYNQISRSDLDLKPRKCLICNELAKVCNKSRAHKLDELLIEIDNIYNLYFNK